MCHLDNQLSVLSNFISDDVIVEILDFKSEVDIFGTQIKGPFVSDSESTGVPVDLGLQRNVIHVEFDMNEVNNVIVSDVGKLQVTQYSIDDRTAVYGELLVQEFT